MVPLKHFFNESEKKDKFLKFCTLDVLVPKCVNELRLTGLFITMRSRKDEPKCF